MPGHVNSLLIEGSFEELVDELAIYLDNLKKTQGDESSAVQSETEALLKDNKKDEVLKKLVTASAVLNSAPEKEFIAAYNLLIHLVRQSPNINMFLPKICQNLSTPITSSPANGGGLALSVLSTIFNILQSDNDTRYHVLIAILRVVRGTSNFETIKPQLKNLDAWLSSWESDEEEARSLYLAISDAAKEAGEEEQAYQYLVKALRTITSDEVDSDEARQLSLRALRSALSYPSHYDFQDLTALDSIQALRKSDPTHFELLELFNAELLDDFNDFNDSHDGFLATEGLDMAALTRKMRLLTLASLAATTPIRSLPYASIAKALQIPAGDVEMWVIDVIRAGLVEGKLSQQTQQFLIHRSTYRVFGENQWKEVAARLDMWRNSLQGVLSVIRAEKEEFLRVKESETKDIENRVNGTIGGGGKRQGRAQQQSTVEVDLD